MTKRDGASIDAALADQIRFMRALRGITQIQLAEKAGISESTIVRIEDRSRGIVSMRILEKIAAALEIGLSIRLVPLKPKPDIKVKGYDEKYPKERLQNSKNPPPCVKCSDDRIAKCEDSGEYCKDYKTYLSYERPQK